MIGVEEYAPVTARLAMLRGATKSPNPPRITVFPCSASGLQAKPTRGLTTCDEFLKTAVLPGLANVKPPGTAKEPTGIWGMGLLAYAATAAAAMGFATLAAKPSSV